MGYAEPQFGCPVLLVRQATDMRKGFDSLSGLVRERLQREPDQVEVYIFINARRNQIRLLTWEGDGLALYYKRL